MSEKGINVLGLCGSLRVKSYNRMALQAARELAPAHMLIDTAEIADIPLYNDDARDRGIPAPVHALEAKLRAADAVLFVSPEYNYSVPGVLKNAIDWISRLPDQPFAGKPVAIMGASGGLFGTARAQYHLRQICVFLDMHPINKPEVMIGQAPTKFDENGKLHDATTRELIGRLLISLGDWTLRLQRK